MGAFKELKPRESDKIQTSITYTLLQKGSGNLFASVRITNHIVSYITVTCQHYNNASVETLGAERIT